MQGRPLLALVLCAVIALAGCAAAPSMEDAGAARGAEETRAPRASAVVADVSAGTNPYHEAFRRPAWTEHPSAVIPGFPADAPALPLTLGEDYRAALEADAAAWASFEPGVVHWVPGTNLLLLTLRPWTEIDVPVGHGGPHARHAVATAASVALACPACYVLVIQDAESLDGEPVRHVAERLPWVDFVASTNTPGDAPLPPFEDRRYADATLALARTGRLFFGASGNFVLPGFDPRAAASPFYLAPTSVPPWSVMVGGAMADCSATAANAGKPAEVVGQYRMLLPIEESVDGYAVSSGTSFATPWVAGSYGHALVRVRESLGDARAADALWAGAPAEAGPLADGRLEATELRDLFNATARWFSPADYAPGCNALAPAPASPAPWIDMGWGFVGPEEANATAELVLSAGAPPEKPAAARAWMSAFDEARRRAYP